MRAAYVLFLLAACMLSAPVLGGGIIPAIKKVIDMLDNLITTLTEEGEDDEAKFAHFTKWVKKEQAETEIEISRLQTDIENTKAILASLNSQKGELTASIAHLKSEIATTTSQINTATDKRNEEHSAHVIEQTNFDNAVKACSKAVEILAQHYGDGTPAAELEKPQFMSLLNTYLATIRQAAISLDKKAHLHSGRRLRIKPRAISLLQGPNDRFQESTGEALSIVDQVKVLAGTFAEDQQTSLDEEASLQKLYDELMVEKRKVLADLVSELGAKTKQLQQVEADIASNSGKLQMLTKHLADEQEYLVSITDQFKVLSEAFEHRKKDRSEEMAAVKQALGVLDKYNTFVQLNTRSTTNGVKCQGCAKAVAFLKQKAKVFKSALLEAAATAASGSDAINEIVKNLEGLIIRMDEEQKFETEHKEWCEKETGLTTKKRDDHRYICEDLKSILANLAEVVEEKKDDLGINEGDQSGEDTSFVDRTKIRDEEKTEFEMDLHEHIEAINALNEAIDILAKYYASRDKKGAAFAQFLQPGGGGKVVTMLSETRAEFEQAKKHIEHDEEVAVTEYQEDKAVHVKVANDLDHDEDTLTVEKQTAEEQIQTSEDDLTSNKNEVASAEDYLNRLGKSCYPLIARYDKRKQLREEEKAAVQDAIKVLEAEA